MHYIDYAIVLLFIAATLVIGYKGGKGITTLREYVIGDRSKMTLLTLTFSFLATNMGAGNLEGIKDYVEKGWIAFIAAGILPAVCMSLIAFVVAPRMYVFFGCMTVGEVMGKLFGTGARYITGGLAAFTATMFIATGFISLGRFTHAVLGIDPWVGLLVGACFIIAYTAHGGIKAVIATDIFQFIVLAIGIPLITYAIFSAAGGTKNIFNQLQLNYPDRLKVVDHPSFFECLGLGICWSILPVGMIYPPHFQRLLMAKNTKQLRHQYLISALLHVVIVGSIFILGISALVQPEGLELKQGSTILGGIIQKYLPIGLKGFAIAGILAVILGSTDSMLQAASSTLENDVVAPLLKKMNFKPNRLNSINVITFFIGAFSMFLGYWYLDKPTALNLEAVKMAAPILTAPLFLGILGIKPSQASFYGGVIATLIAFPFLYIYGTTVLQDLAVPLSIVLNGAVFLAIHFYQNKSFVMVRRAAEASSWQSKGPSFFVRLKESLCHPPNPITQAQKSVAKYGASYLLFGAFFLANYMLPWFMWSTPEANHAGLFLYVRFIGAVLCALLVVQEQWHTRLRKYLPFFWHLTVCYCLPFTNTFMFLANKGSVEWLINIALMVILLFILVDWTTALILAIVGVGAGVLCYMQFIGPINEIELDFQMGYLLLYQFVFAPVIGLLFARRKQRKFDSLTHRHQSLRTTYDTTQDRLLEVLQYQDRVSKGLGEEGIDILADLSTLSKTLSEEAKKSKNASFQQASTQFGAVATFLEEVIYRAKDHLRLQIGEISLPALIQELQKQSHKKHPNLDFTIDLQHNPPYPMVQGDIAQLVYLFMEALYYAKTHNPMQNPIQLVLADASLAYPVHSLQDYTKKVRALRFTVTTEQNLPAGASVYINDLAEETLTKSDNARIIAAHYGLAQYQETPEGITQTYVLPLRLREVRPKNMDLTKEEEEKDSAAYADALAFEEELCNAIAKKLPQADLHKVRKAIALSKKYHAHQQRKTGEPFYTHPLYVAKILLEFMEPDLDMLIAAILHDTVEDTAMSLVQIEALFGPVVRKLVDGVTKLDKGARRLALSKGENLRKLLEEKEEGVLCIKIADRIHNMRTIQGHLDYAKQCKVAEETLCFFVPLAEKLGLNKAVEVLREKAAKVFSRPE